MTGGTHYSFTSAGVLCLMPFVLFLLQYLFLDFRVMSLLAQQKNQILLVQGHFGYKVALELFSLHPFTIDLSTFQGRFQLLVNQLQFGIWVPVVSLWLLFDHRNLKRPLTIKRRPINAWMRAVIGIFFFLFLMMFSRAIGWNVCESLAGEAIAQGNYTDSLQWLDRALFFDPSLDNAVFYHIERGQALSLAYPDQQSDDSRVYIASLLSAQRDYKNAYQQLLVVWQSHKSKSWAVDDMSDVLEHLSELSKPTLVAYLPLYTPPNAQNLLKQDSTAFPWLQILNHVDPGNIYGHYIMGRIEYDLRNYTLCNIQLASVLQLSSNTDLQSSVYTYMALSEAGMGDYSRERILLFQAVQLDSTYHNNIAREELSGLR